MDTPIQRTIKIGSANVGLIGLDLAISQALQKKMTEDNAVSHIYNAVKNHNYIPEAAIETYLEAFRQEYRRHSGTLENQGNENRLMIRILGPGCVSCNRIYTMSIDILQQLSLLADIESINDLDEIWRYGVTSTPALIINGELKSSGRLPAPYELEKWIKEAADL